MATCNFGKVTVNDVFEAQHPFGTDLEGRFLYISDGDRQWLLAAFDFSYMWRSTCLEWRNAVSEKTGIPVSSIWLHTVQGHSAPVAPQLDGPACRTLADRSLGVIQRMIAEAHAAELSYAIVDLEGRFNFNREVYVPELGAVTAWGGQLQTDRPGCPYTQDPDVLLLDGYKPNLPAFERPIYFDRPADPLAALLVFRSRSGKVLGTLTRFTGHPDIVGSCTTKGGSKEYKYHFDWPGYVRKAVEQKLGGIGLCINGPCGNVAMRYTAPDTFEAADAIACRIGSGIAGACVESWQKESPPWQPLRLHAIQTADVDLPIRPAIPRCRAELPIPAQVEQYVDRRRLEIREAQARGERPSRIKQMIDEFFFNAYIVQLVERWTNLTDQELEQRVMTVEVQAAALNDLVLSGLPGESMTETAMWLRAQALGKKLITFDQVNGYHSYLANDEAQVQGGYSYWCSALARNAEPKLRRGALALINSLISAKGQDR